MSADKTLQPYIVIYDEQVSLPIPHWLIFTCSAEDVDHAKEQCLNAYPTCGVLWVHQGVYPDDALDAFCVAKQ